MLLRRQATYAYLLRLSVRILYSLRLLELHLLQRCTHVQCSVVLSRLGLRAVVSLIGKRSCVCLGDLLKLHARTHFVDKLVATV